MLQINVDYDTLYYACEDGSEMLASQAAYFKQMLFNDEREYYNPGPFWVLYMQTEKTVFSSAPPKTQKPHSRSSEKKRKDCGVFQFRIL